MIRGDSAPRARRRVRAWLLAALAALPITAALAATQYLYDDLGRLVLAANSDGSATVYSHDENGNVVTIIQWAASGPVIAGFSPMYGHAGTTVTIFGAGFSATPANNAVTIGGVVAAVSSSTTTTIVSSIPQGADTGPITVTVDGVTATSTQNITVYKPLIASFSPAFVAPGGSVTLTGANLNLVSGGTSLSVAGATVTLTSLSNNQAVFTAPTNTGGPITVNTPYGQATSATNLVIVPNAVGVANVVDHDPADPNGASQALAINQQNKTALLSFQAAASAFYSVQLDSLTLTPSGGSINYTVYGPTGASFASGSVSTTAPSIFLPRTTIAGRYLVAFNSGSKTAVQITAKVELDAVLTANGTTLPLSTTAVYQSKRFVFNATAGDDINFAITQLVMTPNPPNNVRIWVYRPDGYQMGSQYYCYTTDTPGCSKDNNLNETQLINAPVTGSYTVNVVPQGAAMMTFNATLSTDLVGTLTAGTPTTLDFDVVGRQALVTFTATANEVLALRFSSFSMTPAGTGIGYMIYQPNGNVLASNNNLTAAATLNFSIPATGTYSLYVAPRNASTGSAQVVLANGITGTLAANGTTQNFATTLPQQNAYFTFTANAGDDLGLAITNLVTTPNPPNGVRLWIGLPSGYTHIWGEYCYTSTVPGCSWNLFNLPETGTYRVSVDATGQSTNAFSLTLSPHLTSALPVGTPQNITLDSPGEHALLTFTVTAGQNATLHLSGVTTTPAGKSMTMIIYNPAGNQIFSTSTTSQTTLSLQNLAAGTYSVLLAPQHAATATATITRAQEVGGALTPGSSTQSYSTSVPQQHAYYTFSATAGDDLGLAITNLVITPSSPNYVRVWVLPPSGDPIVNGFTCYTTNLPGCSYTMTNLPVTGTYKIRIESQGPSTMTFDLTLSQHSVATLTSGTPQNVVLDLPGRHALLTFSATAGQAAALHLGSVSTTPAGKSMKMSVYNPSGSLINSPSTTTQTTLNLTNLAAGTYTVVISAADASTGTAAVTFANGLTGALPANGTTQNFVSTVPQQNGYFTFTATAGDDFGFALTNLTLTPSSPNMVSVWVLPPSGDPIVNGPWCYLTAVPGCSYNMLNLPLTGTYNVRIESQGQSTMTFDLTLSPYLTGALTFGTPLSVTLDSPGERAWLSFAATLGQNAVLTFGSVVTTPSGKVIGKYVYNAAGSQIASTTNNTLNLTNLAAGTYQVLLQPADAATATLDVTIN